MKKLILTLIIGLAFTIPVFANGDDDTDRLSTNQSYTFSPGYLNAAKQKTESILRQEAPKKSLYDKVVEYVQSKLGKDMSEGTQDKQKITPNLQHRTGGTEDAPQATTLIDSANYNINIGTGADKVYENGRLISEVIDGRRYVYAGFDNVGKYTIREAIAVAKEGDAIIVKSGRFYNEDIFIKNGVSLYGGYDESGVRDLSVMTSTIFGYISANHLSAPTEISGFNVLGGGYLRESLHIDSSSNLTVSNNTFRFLVSTLSSSVLFKNNTFGISGLYVFNADKSARIISENNNYNGDVWLRLSYSESFPNSGLYNNDYYYVLSKNDYFYSSSKYIDYTGLGGTISIANPANVLNDVLTPATSPYNIVTNSSSTKSSFLPSDYRLASPYFNKLDEYRLSSDMLLNTRTGKELEGNTLTSIFKGLLANENLLSQGASSSIDPAALARLMRGSLNESALSIPGGDINTQEMSIAMALANILKNPTEDQKILIDAIKGLIQDMSNVENEGEKGTDPELKKAADNLIQMVANLLVAQAVPDLFKEGDIQGIKGIFNELNASKTDIMRKYALSTAPYYDKLKRDIEKNVNALQLNNIISNTISDEELKNMPRSDIDRIMEKLKKLDKRSFEADYILQQESKYRKEYLDPNKQKLEEDMKLLLQDVIKKLNMTLEAVSKKK